MFNLHGKRVLVTGATGGLGSEIARLFHSRGALVALSGTRIEKLNALAKELGERSYVIECNLSDGEAVDKLPGEVNTLSLAGPLIYLLLMLV